MITIDILIDAVQAGRGRSGSRHYSDKDSLQENSDGETIKRKTPKRKPSEDKKADSKPTSVSGLPPKRKPSVNAEEVPTPKKSSQKEEYIITRQKKGQFDLDPNILQDATSRPGGTPKKKKAKGEYSSKEFMDQSKLHSLKLRDIERQEKEHRDKLLGIIPEKESATWKESSHQTNTSIRFEDDISDEEDGGIHRRPHGFKKRIEESSYPTPVVGPDKTKLIVPVPPPKEPPQIEKQRSASPGSVDDQIDHLLRNTQGKQIYIIKDDDAPIEQRYKLVAEVYTDKHTYKELTPFIETGEIKKIKGDNVSPLGTASKAKTMTKKKKTKKGSKGDSDSDYDTFPMHHYTREIIKNGEFDNSFEEYIFDPIIVNGSHKETMLKAAKEKKKREKDKIRKEQELAKLKETETFYLLNKNRLKLPEPGTKEARDRERRIRPHPSPSSSEDDHSRSANKSRSPDIRNNYYSGVEDNDILGKSQTKEPSSGERTNRKKENLQRLDVDQINDLHKDQVKKAALVHADKPPAPEKPKPPAVVAPENIVAPVNDSLHSEKQAQIVNSTLMDTSKVSQEPPVKPPSAPVEPTGSMIGNSGLPSPPLPAAGSEPSKSISASMMQSSKVATPPISSPKAETVLDPSPIADQSKIDEQEKLDTSVVEVEETKTPEEKPLPPSPVKKADEPEPPKPSALKGNPFLAKQAQQAPPAPSPRPEEKKVEGALKSNPFLAKQAQQQAPTAPAAKPEGNKIEGGLKSNPFLAKQAPQQAPAAPPKPDEKKVDGEAGGALKSNPFLAKQAAPKVTPPPPVVKKPEEKKPDVKPPLLKPAEAKPAEPKPAESKVEGDDDAPKLGLKNNPFLNKKPTEPALPQKSLSPPKPPGQPALIADKLKDNPFLKPKSNEALPPLPPKSPKSPAEGDGKLAQLKSAFK